VNTAFELLAFSAIMAVAQFSPGPDMILLTRTALHHGGRAGTITACGIATGLAVHSAIALGGVGYIFTTESNLLPFIKCLASGYLLYLAGRIFLSARDSSCASAPQQGSHYLRGLLCNLFNPKAALMLSSICAPFLQGHQGVSRPLTLGAIIVLQGALLWTLWVRGLRVPALRRGYDRHQTAINRCFAILLALLSAWVWIR
jgi:threonine/homoserine/homoserine lactone efflux protein